VIDNDVITGIIVIIIAYVLGSIPSAYIITRLVKGKDIRKLGGGNVGARNVWVEVGKVPSIAVGVFDVAKGAGAVVLAVWLLDGPSMQLVDTPQLFVMAAGVAVVAGHIWSVFLKFTGGNGLATTLGVLAVLLTRELGIAVALILILVVITRNLILSVNISVVSLPIIAWLLGEPWQFIIYPIVLVVVMLLNFAPVIKNDMVQAGSTENFIAELLRRDKARKKE